MMETDKSKMHRKTMLYATISTMIASLSGCSITPDPHMNEPRPDYSERTPLVVIPNHSAFGDIATGDADGDGLADLFEADGFGNIFLHKNMGRRYAKINELILRVGSNPNIAASDINGDGLADILYIDNDGKVYSHMNLGDLKFEQ